jgi:hypothetical protein
MRRRCQDPNDKTFAFYGGRGITVCERWQDFTAFYEDMAPRPSPQHQLDRIDNNGNYEPGNCRWVTPIENGNNKRNNTLYEWRGESLTLPEWARRTGINYGALQSRVDRLGWSIERALTTPIRPRGTTS